MFWVGSQSQENRLKSQGQRDDKVSSVAPIWTPSILGSTENLYTYTRQFIQSRIDSYSSQGRRPLRSMQDLYSPVIEELSSFPLHHGLDPDTDLKTGAIDIVFSPEEVTAQAKSEFAGLLLRGEFVHQLLMGGEANRLKEDVHQFADIQIPSDDELAMYFLDIGYMVHQPRSLMWGPRQLLQLRLQIERIAEEYYDEFHISPAEAVKSQSFIFNTNSKWSARLERDLYDHGFYGFNQDRIVICPSQTAQPFDFADGNLVPAHLEEPVVFSHGWSELEMAMPHAAYRLNIAGIREPLNMDALQFVIDHFGVKMGHQYRVNDLRNLTPDILDIPYLAKEWELIKGGHGYIVRTVGSFDNTEGGIPLAVTKPGWQGHHFILPDTTGVSDPKSKRFFESITEAIPSHRFSNSFDPKKLRSVLRDYGIAPDFKLKIFEDQPLVFPQYVTGMLCAIPKLLSVTIHLKGEEDISFKNLKNLKKAVELWNKQTENPQMARLIKQYAVQSTPILALESEHPRVVVLGAGGSIGKETIRQLSERYTVAAITRSAGDYPPNVEVYRISPYNLSALRAGVQRNQWILNFAGIPGSGKDAENTAALLTANGFLPGLLWAVVTDSHREQSVHVLMASTQRVYALSRSRLGDDQSALPLSPELESWVNSAVALFTANQSRLLTLEDGEETLTQLAISFLTEHPVPAQADAYALSKIVGERLTAQIPGSIILRISRTYGNSERSTHLLSRIVGDRLAGRPGNMPQGRFDFIHYDDLVKFIENLILSPSDVPVINVASGDENAIDASALASLIEEELPGEAIRISGQDQPPYVPLLNENFSAALRQPLTTLKEGLCRYIEERLTETLDLREHEVTSETIRKAIETETGPLINVLRGASLTYVFDGHLQRARHIYRTADCPELSFEEISGLLTPHRLALEPRSVLSSDVLLKMIFPNGDLLLTRTPIEIPMRGHLPDPVIVLDIGGTSFRVGAVDGNGKFIGNVLRFPTPNFLDNPDAQSEVLQKKLIDEIQNQIAFIRSQNPDRKFRHVSIGFAGPIDRQGLVRFAPTIWGEKGRNYPLLAVLETRMPDLQFVIANDMTATGFRYLPSRPNKRFGILTVSSGVGIRMMDGRHPEKILKDPDAIIAGEVGHTVVDTAPDALLCDCGGRGHLGALASGRGAERIMRCAAQKQPDKFRASVLFNRQEDPTKLTNEDLVFAVNHKDAFALELLDQVTDPLAMTVALVNGTVGADEYIVVGGFGLAMGDAYRNSLLHNLRKRTNKHISDETLSSWITLGHNDDDNVLLGAANMASYTFWQEPTSRYQTDAAGHLQIRADASRQMDQRIIFTRNLFEPANRTLINLVEAHHAFFILDRAVASLGPAIQAYADHWKIPTKIVFLKEGEQNKTLEEVVRLLNDAETFGLDRRSYFIAIGGGALMDVVGFTASIFRRGVPYIRVPTTLLGQVDASVGVKTGINYGGIKNLVGTFVGPAAVINDIQFLCSLSQRQLASGLSEVIKATAVRDTAGFARLEQSYPDVLKINHTGAGASDVQQIVEIGLRNHLEELEKDFYEVSLKRILNFGHEFGHRLEAAAHGRLAHGEAVALGMLLATEIGFQKGITPLETRNRLYRLIENVGLPVYDEMMTPQVLFPAVEEARKHQGGNFNLVVPTSIGQATFLQDVSEHDLQKALKALGDAPERAYPQIVQMLRNLDDPHKSVRQQADNDLLFNEKKPWGVQALTNVIVREHDKEGKGLIPDYGLILNAVVSLHRFSPSRITENVPPCDRTVLEHYLHDLRWLPDEYGHSDFHTHTQVSDGRKTIHELIDAAVREGVKWIALTDHNTTAGYQEARKYGEEKGIHVIPGMEITCPVRTRDGLNEVHVVALNIDPNNVELMDVARKAKVYAHTNDQLFKTIAYGRRIQILSKQLGIPFALSFKNIFKSMLRFSRRKAQNMGLEELVEDLNQRLTELDQDNLFDEHLIMAADHLRDGPDLTSQDCKILELIRGGDPKIAYLTNDLVTATDFLEILRMQRADQKECTAAGQLLQDIFGEDFNPAKLQSLRQKADLAIVQFDNADARRFQFLREERKESARGINSDPGDIILRKVPLDSVLHAIHHAGGIAVLAHPGLYAEQSGFQSWERKADWPNRFYQDVLYGKPFDGVEIGYTYFDVNEIQVVDGDNGATLESKFFRNHFRKQNRFFSTGTDWHGREESTAGGRKAEIEKNTRLGTGYRNNLRCGYGQVRDLVAWSVRRMVALTDPFSRLALWNFIMNQWDDGRINVFLTLIQPERQLVQEAINLFPENLLVKAALGESSANPAIGSWLLAHPIGSVTERNLDSEIDTEEAVMLVRDDKKHLHLLTDRDHPGRVNVRNVPDLEEFIPEFNRATEKTDLYAYHSPQYFKYQLFDAWEMLPRSVQKSLLALFKEKKVPLTYKAGEPLDDFSLLLETNRSHDVAPGRGGILLQDNRLIIGEDQQGAEYQLEMKGVGPYDGTFQMRTRNILRGMLDGVPSKTISEVARGYVDHDYGYLEADQLESLRLESQSAFHSSSRVAFVVSFMIEGQRLSLIGRLSPGNRRMGQFWWGQQPDEEMQGHLAQNLGKAVAGMLLERRPLVHRAMNLENLLDDIGGIPAYANAGSVTYLYTQRRAFDFMRAFLAIAESRALTRFKQLHTSDHPAEDERFRPHFWNGFLDVFIESFKVPDEVKDKLMEAYALTSNRRASDEIVKLIWENFLALEIIKNRNLFKVNPVKDFLEPTNSNEVKLLAPLTHPYGWVMQEIVLYQHVLDSNQLEPSLKRYIVRCLRQLNKLASANNVSICSTPELKAAA